MAEKTKNSKSSKQLNQPPSKLSHGIKEVPLKYVIPDDMQLTFSDGLIVQSGDSEFILSFFQTKRPVVLNEAEGEKIKEVETQCVVRIILTPQQMHKNIEALSKNFEAWIQRMKSGETNNATE